MSPTSSRIFRPIQGNGPVQDLTLIDLQCGGYAAGGIIGSSPANLNAGPVAAGSMVSLRWTLWPSSHVSPVITYMARCGNDNCATYLPGTEVLTGCGAVWFKIQEAGRTGTTNVWGDTPLMTVGSDITYTILRRCWIIHPYTYPGAQFYPSCHQIKITGSGTSTGPASKVVIPGGYSSSDPGITYDAYQATTYTIPGPTLFTC
ncbi:hypothetical protein BDZ45DRAFT_703720 [Acephala macrosclerotiorum]|nr:hypothetical protein BDZ45DRAFT_703720 [Acephala macrosclerotiorum]